MSMTKEEIQIQIDNIIDLFSNGWITEYERDKRVKDLDPNYKPTVKTNNNVSQSYEFNFETMSQVSQVDYQQEESYTSSYQTSDHIGSYYGYQPQQQSDNVPIKSYDDIPVLNYEFESSDNRNSNNNNSSSTRNKVNVKQQPQKTVVEEPKPVEQGSFAAMFLSQPTSPKTKPLVEVVKSRVGVDAGIQFVPLGTTCQTYIDLRGWEKSKLSSEEPDTPTEDTKDQWRQEQLDLAKRVVIGNPLNLSVAKGKTNVKYIGGVDISFAKNSSIDACACLIVLEYPSLKLVYQSYKMVRLTEPYIAGYLAFREAPHLLPLWQDLVKNYSQFKPDVLIIDGNGINHMRGCGSACHMGVLFDVPTIGVAKQLLVANGITDQYISNGFLNSNIVEMINNRTKQSMGFALHNSQKEIIYISPGHKLDPQTALSIVQATLNARPIPEPTFQADKLSRDFLYKYYYKFK